MADNPDEWFDVVDANDRVTGQARRGEVHARKLLHRAVHILVQRSNGDIFLQQRSMEKDQHPGKWSASASGHLDAGESYDAAAQRELKEELGCLADLVQLARLPASSATGHEFVNIYGAEAEGPFVLHPDEIMDGRWFAPSVIDNWIQDDPEVFASSFVAVWKAVQVGKRK